MLGLRIESACRRGEHWPPDDALIRLVRVGQGVCLTSNSVLGHKH
jgi:hypothetical protein